MLDPATGDTLAVYDTGPNPFGAAFSPDGDRAYVTDKNAGTLSEIDADDGTVYAQVSVGRTPQQPVLGQDGRIYIALSGDEGIGVVDTAGGALTVLPKIATGAGSKPHIVSLSPDGATLWATVQGTDPRVLSVDLATGTIRDYRYDMVPRVIHATDDGAWFTAHHSTGLHFIDLATGTPSTPFMDSFGKHSEAKKQIEGVFAAGDLVSITHEGRKALVVIKQLADGTLKRIRNISGRAAPPYWTTIDPSGQVAYVSIPEKVTDGVAAGGVVEAWDLTKCSSRPMWTATLGGKPKRMAVTE
jgi:YVTN family beta-propeller protein